MFALDIHVIYAEPIASGCGRMATLAKLDVGRDTEELYVRAQRTPIAQCRRKKLPTKVSNEKFGKPKEIS